MELRVEGVTFLLRPVAPWPEPDPYWIKTKALLNLAEGLENQFRQKKETLGSGYIAKLVQKIFDNIHISFVDVHIRYEDSALVKGAYSIGLTVESFKMFTTDQARKQTWLDRTAKNKQNEPMFKLAQLSSLKMYCNPPKCLNRMDLIASLILPKILIPLLTFKFDHEDYKSVKSAT